jgi:hypothetical protein
MASRSKPTIGAILMVAAAAALVAAPASAEVSSVDAYGGQAAVLGKPAHRHSRGVTRRGGRTGRERASGTGSGGSAGPPAGVGSHAGSAAPPRGKRTGTGASVVAGITGGRQSSPLAAATASSGSLSLSGLDVLSLIAIMVCLLGAGVLIRRLARSPSP